MVVIVICKWFPVAPLTYGDSDRDTEYRQKLQNYLKTEKVTKIDLSKPVTVELEFGVAAARLPRGMDLDNLVLNTINAFNGVLWDDDRQIVGITAKRVPVQSKEYVALIVRQE